MILPPGWPFIECRCEQNTRPSLEDPDLRRDQADGRIRPPRRRCDRRGRQFRGPYRLRGSGRPDHGRGRRRGDARPDRHASPRDALRCIARRPGRSERCRGPRRHRGADSHPRRRHPARRMDHLYPRRRSALLHPQVMAGPRRTPPARSAHPRPGHHRAPGTHPGLGAADAQHRGVQQRRPARGGPVGLHPRPGVRRRDRQGRTRPVDRHPARTGQQLLHLRPVLGSDSAQAATAESGPRRPRRPRRDGAVLRSGRDHAVRGTRDGADPPPDVSALTQRRDAHHARPGDVRRRVGDLLSLRTAVTVRFRRTAENPCAPVIRYHRRAVPNRRYDDQPRRALFCRSFRDARDVRGPVQQAHQGESIRLARKRGVVRPVLRGERDQGEHLYRVLPRA